MLIRQFLIMVILALPIFPIVALAGDPPEDTPKGWRFTVSVGAIYASAFVGSKDYQIYAYPDVSVEFKDLFFASVKDGVGFNVIHTNGWRAGPLVKYEFERKENGNNPFLVAGRKTSALKGLGNNTATLEFGSFVEYSYKAFAYKVELRQGIDGHKGMIGEASIDYADTIERFGFPIIYTFGPRVKFAGSAYNNAYFGINQTQSLNSGLNRYDSGGGIVSYGAGGFMAMPLSEQASVSLFGGYDRLGSEAAGSPLIKQRGSENQFIIGLSAAYKFDL